MELEQNEGSLAELMNLTKNRSLLACADAFEVNIVLKLLEKHTGHSDAASVATVINSLMEVDSSVFERYNDQYRFSER